MKMANLKDLYVEELRDLYNAEKQLIKALPRMAKAASADQLAAAFEDHLEETRGQVERLEAVFRGLKASPGGKKCEAMQGLIAEAESMMRDADDPDVLDAALISAAQRVEHYEIAGYGTVRTYARLLGREGDVTLLQETLDEEGRADKKLTRLAERVINQRAMSR
ncbi:MAG: ferritin-like domain-containing protein [Phycisphaerales bacterium]